MSALITAADEESLPTAARESMVRMPNPGVVDDGTADVGTDEGSAGTGAEAA